MQHQKYFFRDTMTQPENILSGIFFIFVFVQGIALP